MMLLLAVLPCLVMAQKKFENSYFTINLPNGWDCQRIDDASVHMEGVEFNNTGDMYNIGMLLGIENVQDPKSALQNQITIKESNPLFVNATFGDVHPSVFMGKKCQSFDFDTTVDGKHFKGAAYSFNEGGCTVIVIGSYKVGTKSNLPQVWRTIKWKQHKKVEHYGSLREEMADYCKGLNAMLAQKQLVAQGTQTVSIEQMPYEDCIVYTYALLDYSKDQFTAEQINNMRDYYRTEMVDNQLKAMAQQDELVKRCIDAGYSFKFVILDKNKDFLYDVKVTPNEK